MKGLVVLLAVLAAPAAALGQVVSEAPEGVAIVVYPGGETRRPGRNLYEGLVMVTERRTVDLPAGPSRISFRGVAEGIVAQTVAVQGLPGGVKEQNFNYQLLSPGSLLGNSDGRTVSIVRTDKATGKTTQERARVVSSANGVVLDIEGRIEALNCSAQPEKIVFDDLPPGYSDKPTLSVDVVAPSASRAVVTLSYLATGVAWSADYVAKIAANGRTLDLASWITIGNRSATTFADAPVQVLAGRLERTPGDTLPVSPPRRYVNPMCWEINSGRRSEYPYGPPPPPPSAPMMAAMPTAMLESVAVTGAFARAKPEVVADDLGDYKLYSLPERTTLAAYQTKQLRMFERRAVAFAKVYRVELRSVFGSEGDNEPQAMAIVAELENRRAKGLGLPLPAGRVSIFQPGEAGRVLFTGEDKVRDTAQDLPFEFKLGDAPNVQSQTRIVSRTTVGNRARVSVEVTLTNAGATPADVQIRESAGAENFRVVTQSTAHGLKYGAPQWVVRLGANQSQVLTYTLERRA